jgi:branched-chain amino acid transport system substrate-binding protein
MKEYYAFMKQWAPNEAASDSTAAFAYMTSMLTEKILRNCGNDLSRENVLRQGTTLRDVELPLLLAGIRVSYSATDYTPLKQGRMARFDGAKWVRFGDLVSVEDAP